MSETCDLRPFLYDQVPAPDDVSGLQLSQEQLQNYLKEMLDAVCADVTTLENAGGGGGASTFLGLSDTPASYSGQANKRVVVNAGETALEFETIPAAGADTNGLTLDYSTSEQTCARTYTGGETIFQKTIVFGALPNNTTKSVAHGIGVAFRIIRFEFVARRASDGVTVPVPLISNTAIGGQTQLSWTSTNIVARNSVNSSAFLGDITLWYLKV